MSPDGAHLITSTGDGLVCRRLSDGAVLRRIDTPVRAGAVWSPDGRHIAVHTRHEGAYAATVFDPLNGSTPVIAELHPDNGASLGFDFTPDGRAFVFADDVDSDGNRPVVAHVTRVPLDGAAGGRLLPWGAPRSSYALPDDAVPEHLAACAQGVFTWYVGDGFFTRDDGSALWHITESARGHSVSPTRTTMVSDTHAGLVLRTLSDGAVTALEGGVEPGNALVWSADGLRFAVDAAVRIEGGFAPAQAVFEGPSLVAVVRDAQPVVHRDHVAHGGFLLDGWRNVALDAQGRALVLADNEAGELRAWSVGPEPRLLWRCGLDDLAWVMWNGPTVVAASATQLMLVDGASGRVRATTPVD